MTDSDLLFKLAKAWKLLDRLGELDHVRASEEFEHLSELLEHFNKTICKPTNEYLLASDVTDELEFDDFRVDLLNYLREKASEERRSNAEAEAHNACLGPNYWCKEAFQKGKEATFEDFDELLNSHGLESTDEFETKKAVSEAYACILEIVEAKFSHSGNLEHIHGLVELEVGREMKHQTTEHARRIIATCGIVNKPNDKKRARKM